MNRAFKTQFHNGEPDEKTIVTVSLTVNNGKRFKRLDKKGKKNLVVILQDFKNLIDGFISELEPPILTKNKK